MANLHLPRNLQIWGPGYIASRLRAARSPLNRILPVNVWLSIADHFEPLGMGASESKARETVERWKQQWRAIANRHEDSDGSRPQYTFFYPEEEYRPELLDCLATLTDEHIADVEIHLHHDGEGERDFVDRISGFKQALFSTHGLLRKRSGEIIFGFIHGNWALDNSRPDGRMCGLNNEIHLLRDLGCYADFTMPSGFSPTQSRLVNSIYWAVDDTHASKSYDCGTPVDKEAFGTGDLLMVPGPFGLRWRERLIPRLETGELAGYDLPTPYRFARWLDLAPRIGNDIFVKLYTHGCQDRNSFPLLEQGGLDQLFQIARQTCEARRYQLHYVSTWNQFAAIERACSSGASATPASRSQYDHHALPASVRAR